MISFGAKVQYDPKPVERAVEKAKIKSFSHAAGAIRKDARDSIEKASKALGVKTRAGTKRDAQGRFLKGSGRVRRAKGARKGSPPGTPPYTNRGLIKRAIRFDASKDGAVVGTLKSVFGTAGAAHEHGGQYKGGEYPQRPFMFPALERNAGRFAEAFRGSIGR